MHRIVKILILMAFLIVGVSTVMAKSAYLNLFKSTYPAASTSQIASCLLCHTSPTGAGGTLNSYGNSYLGSGHVFATIESLDSDGDGFTNIAEITALTFPGDATSYPAVTSYQLTVTMAGTGAGTVTPDTGALAWNGSVGTASYAANTVVNLTAAPAVGSSFGGWSGACTGATNPCTVTMSQAQSVTATFSTSSCASQLIKVGGTSSFYPTIQAAYNVLTNGQGVEMQAVDFAEILLLQNNTNVYLSGGYGCDFTTNPSFSTIIGSVTLNGGTVVFDKIIVR